jgi:hypothetical protein
MTKLFGRNEFLNDIFAIAVDSGIDYWAEIEDCKYTIPIASIRDIEENKKYILNKDVIEKGLNLIVTNPSFNLADYYIKDILFANRNNDAGDIDDIAADAIVQAGLFGEIVYG